ncbi:MFS transporter [Roseomonas elaeocarpi]|uniref:MFS transporter n=1 Tax=Roseomonas elaeocarpi TaxID=907779 RepID=A0ABV6JSY2_9PROT
MNGTDEELALGQGPSRGLILLLAFSCGLAVANIYYAQPLIGLIAPAIGLGPAAAGLVVTLTQLGYCAGLILLVPLGDLLENRRLVALTLTGSVVALLGAALANSSAVFLLAALLIGISSVAVQMLVPLAAHMTPTARRGQVVGTVMSGLLLGILLARPAASLIADHFGWRAVFALSAALMAGLTLILWRWLPQRHPHPQSGYGALLRSLWPVLRDTPVLRRRAAYQTAQFCGFSLFWTAVPLHLAGPSFALSQSAIALFALAGAAGALVAPLAGRLADRGLTRPSTGIAIGLVLAAFAIAWLGRESLAALVVAAIVLDSGVQITQIQGQRAIYTLRPEIRSRLNGLYMALFFLGGALGSTMASVLQTHGGWSGVAWFGMAVSAVALVFYATEFTARRTAAA